MSNLQSQINGLGRRDRELTEGIASVAALAQPMLLPGQHFAMRAGWGSYDDANAVGFSAAGVVASSLLSQGRGTLTLDGGVGFGTSEGEMAGRAGRRSAGRPAERPARFVAGLGTSAYNGACDLPLPFAGICSVSASARVHWRRACRRPIRPRRCRRKW